MNVLAMTLEYEGISIVELPFADDHVEAQLLGDHVLGRFHRIRQLDFMPLFLQRHPQCVPDWCDVAGDQNLHELTPGGNRPAHAHDEFSENGGLRADLKM
jgi:hypothetical protein